MSKTHHVDIKYDGIMAVCTSQISFNPGDIVIFHYGDSCVKYLAGPSDGLSSCDGCDLLDKSPTTPGTISRCKIRSIRNNCLCLLDSNGVLRHIDRVLEEI